ALYHIYDERKISEARSEQHQNAHSKFSGKAPFFGNCGIWFILFHVFLKFSFFLSFLPAVGFALFFSTRQQHPFVHCAHCPHRRTPQTFMQESQADEIWISL